MTRLCQSVTVARRAKPRQGETLAVYIDRLLEGPPRLSVKALSRQLELLDGSTAKTWERTLRRWTAGDVSAISEENAAVVSKALNADFAAFVRGGNAVKDQLTRALSRIEALEKRLEALEQT